MATISILANTVRQSIADCDDTAFGAGTLTWQDSVHSWKAGPGEVMTMENLFIIYFFSLAAMTIRVLNSLTCKKCKITKKSVCFKLRN